MVIDHLVTRDAA